MLRSAFYLARKDVQYMLREKETLLWTFLMPIMFFWFIGTVTGGGGMGPTTDRKDTLVLHASNATGFLADELTGRLEDQDLHVQRARTAEESAEWSRFRRQLTVPDTFSEQVVAGEPVELAFQRIDPGIDAQFDELRVSLAVYTLLADLVLVRERNTPISAESLAEVRARPRNLELDVRSAGNLVEPPTGFEQAIPGTMVMFTMMVLLTSGAVLLLIERRQGLLRRLASAPMSRGSIVLGKWGGRMALAAIQITFAMIVGSLLFGVRWGSGTGQFLAIVAIVAGWAALCASMGILLGAWARTEGQAIGLAVVGTMAMAALGGCWWPIEVTPRWMQQAAMLLPTGWTMDAMHKMISFGDDPLSVLPHLTALLVSAVVLGAIAARKFRFQ
ncbi:MAG: ABC transporter permease [Planctomycetota bacterium]|jgi:ABC-type multidrug transport system permease subunit